MPLDKILTAHPAPPPLALPHPLVLGRASLAGFPSPAQDHEGRLLDLNEHFDSGDGASVSWAIIILRYLRT